MRASKAALQKLLGRSRFVSGYGLKLLAISDAECTIAMPFRKALERPGGTVNGPAFMAAADCAMWLAIKRHIGLEHDAVTSELNTAFLSAARRETVYCSACSSSASASSTAPPNATTGAASCSRTTP
jgi:acyl-coenzyme A thioesterase PaaI-like protein